jgi:hypothetical protein
MTTPQRTFVVCSSAIAAMVVVEGVLLFLLYSRSHPTPVEGGTATATAAAREPPSPSGTTDGAPLPPRPRTEAPAAVPASGITGALVWMTGSAVGLVVLAAVILFHFLPSIIAFVRGHPNAPAICAVNLLLGCTFLGWVAALVWSLTEVRSREHHHYHHPLPGKFPTSAG